MNTTLWYIPRCRTADQAFANPVPLGHGLSGVAPLGLSCVLRRVGNVRIKPNGSEAFPMATQDRASAFCVIEAFSE
jgi:hypothetical protein